MNHIQTMVNVIMPQALRNIMPQIGNNLIINIKDSSMLSMIGVVELFYATKGVAGAYYTYFEAFTITMVITLSLPSPAPEFCVTGRRRWTVRTATISLPRIRSPTPAAW